MSLQVVGRLCAFLGQLAVPFRGCTTLAHATGSAFSANGLSAASICHPRQSRHRLRRRLGQGLRDLLRRVPRRITLDVRCRTSVLLFRLPVPVAIERQVVLSSIVVALQLLPQPRISLRFDHRDCGSVATGEAADDRSKQLLRQPQLQPAAQTRRRRRRSGEGARAHSKHRRARLMSMDSAHDDAVAAWPTDAMAAATEPLSPADSASELPDLSSSWHKTAATLSLPRGRPRNHAHQSDTEGCSASSSPRQRNSRAPDAADPNSSHHAVAQAATRSQCRARATKSAFSSAGAAAEALRSHPLTGLHSDSDADALYPCTSTPQTAPRLTWPALPCSHLSPAGSCCNSEIGRSSAVTDDEAAEHWVIPDACTGNKSFSQQSSSQQSTAVQSLGHDGSGGGCPSSVAAVLGDAQLLAFGALIGEAASAAAMTALGGCGAVGDSPGCLFGASAEGAGSWKLIVQVSLPAFPLIIPRCELLHARVMHVNPDFLCCVFPMATSSSLLRVMVQSLALRAILRIKTQSCTSALPQEQQPGLTYSAWRAPLRNGLYMYACRAVYEDADPAALRAFALDDAARGLWDDNHVATLRLDRDEDGDAPTGSSCIHHYRCQSSLPQSA